MKYKGKIHDITMGNPPLKTKSSKGLDFKLIPPFNIGKKYCRGKYQYDINNENVKCECVIVLGGE